MEERVPGNNSLILPPNADIPVTGLAQSAKDKNRFTAAYPTISASESHLNPALLGAWGNILPHPELPPRPGSPART